MKSSQRQIFSSVYLLSRLEGFNSTTELPFAGSIFT